MTSRIPSILFWLLLACASAQDIVVNPGLLALSLRQRIYVETVNRDRPSQEDHLSKVNLLEALAKDQNAPPDITRAYQSVFKLSRITKLGDGSILIQFVNLDGTVSNLLDTKVQIKRFKGSMQQLFALLASTLPAIRLDTTGEVFLDRDEGIENIALEIETFEGSIRNLLIRITSEQKRLRGYHALFQLPAKSKPDVVIRFLVPPL